MEAKHCIWKRAFFAALILGSVAAAAADELQDKLRSIAADAHGKVAVACSLPGTSLNCDLSPDAKPPMQSVFKLPLAIAVLHRVEKGSLRLNQPVRFRPEDRILPRTHSPLQDRHPAANVDISLRELLHLALADSDNVAADILLRSIGGPRYVNGYIGSLGISGFHLEDGEHGLYRDSSAQYRNWMSPAAAVRLLRLLSDHPPLSPDHAALVFEWMRASVRPRLAADLPSGTVVFHKAGTSGVDAGVAHATNDVGLIVLPDGRRVAVAVFLTDSTADETTRDEVISCIGRAIYNAALKTGYSTSAKTDITARH